MIAMFVFPLVVALTGAAGCGLCRAAGIDPHARSMLFAALAGAAAAMLAWVPLLLVRSAGRRPSRRQPWPQR